MIRVFPRRTKWTPNDDLAFIGDPPLFRPEDQLVCISTTFTWDIPEAKRLAAAWKQYYPFVKIGGPAFDDCGGFFTPGLFLKPGVTITSRGCPRNCPWCFVPKREGAIRELEIEDGWIVQDNNLLACSRPHIEKVFEMLKDQKRGIKFSGGLDSELFKAWHLSLLKEIEISELWFSCDSHPEIFELERVVDLLNGIPERKKRCYVLIGFGKDRLSDAEFRLQYVYDLDFLPFAQLYRGPGQRQYTRDWLDLNRKWSRPAAYRGRI